MILAQFTCDNGAGKVTYERYPQGSQNQGYDLVSEFEYESRSKKAMKYTIRAYIIIAITL